MSHSTSPEWGIKWDSNRKLTEVRIDIEDLPSSTKMVKRWDSFLILICPLIINISAWAGKGDSKVEKTELHFSVCESSPRAAIEKMDATEDESETLRIYYFDTDKIEQYKHGMVLRLRTPKNADAESTVKLKVNHRFIEQVPKWMNSVGFKCEEDSYGDHSTLNCSLNSKVPENVVERFKRDHRRVGELFTAKQLRFIRESGFSEPEFSRLRSIGPILSKKSDMLAHKSRGSLSFNFEVFRLDSSLALMEISRRVPVESAGFEYRRMLAKIQRWGLELCPEQESKTRQVLEYFLNLN